MKTTNILGKLSPADMPMADTLQCGMTTAYYEAPTTSRTVVETEGSFCGSIIDENKPETQTGISISEHGFASEPDENGKVPDWELNLDEKPWDE